MIYCFFLCTCWAIYNLYIFSFCIWYRRSIINLQWSKHWITTNRKFLNISWSSFFNAWRMFNICIHFKCANTWYYTYKWCRLDGSDFLCCNYSTTTTTAARNMRSSATFLYKHRGNLSRSRRYYIRSWTKLWLFIYAA